MERNIPLDTWLRRSGITESFYALAEVLPGAGVVVADAERRVLYWSPEAARITGHNAEDMEGRICPDGIICDKGEPRPFGAAVRVHRADGSQIWVRHYTRILSEAGGTLGAVHVLALEGTGHPGISAAVTENGVTDFHGLITRDPAMTRVLEVVRHVAETEATVLIRGESGTGKELVAKGIHLEGHRQDGPFVAVNCAAFTATLLESELFGHTKGAFTGAVASRKGIFARADGGTLFLDEVAELPLNLQAKLLRVLQERRFVPVGGAEPVHTDVRVIAATHQSLREAVKEGRFREDLMFRLRVVPIFIPPLRERPLDIDLLIRHFMASVQQTSSRVMTGISPEGMRALLSYPWPGNVREIRNVMEYAFAVGRGPVIGLDDLPPEFREERLSQGRSRRTGTEADTNQLVQDALDACGGDIHAAAAQLGVSRTTFWRMRKKAESD